MADGLLNMRSRPYYDELSAEQQISRDQDASQALQDLYRGSTYMPFDLLGAPVDLLSQGLGLLGVNTGDSPFLGSQNLMEMYDYVTPSDFAYPKNTPEELAGRFAGGMINPVTAGQSFVRAGARGLDFLEDIGDAATARQLQAGNSFQLNSGVDVDPLLSTVGEAVKKSRAPAPDEIGKPLLTQGDRLRSMTEAERVKITKDLPYFGTEEFPAETLLGEEVVFMPADRMRAGIVYEGLPEAPIERPKGLLGGQKFGATQQSVEQGLGFASLDPAIANRLTGSGAKYAIVGAMDKYSQLSNRDMADIIAQQVQAYQREGYITKSNMKDLKKRMLKVGDAGEASLAKSKAAGEKPKSGASDKAALKKIPDLDSPEIFDFLRNATFETRKQFGLILNQAGSRKLGAPSIERILQETIDPEQAGAIAMQGNVLVRLDKKAPIDVERAGGVGHSSYPIGIFGTPVAQIKYGVRAEDLFSETVADWLNSGGQPSRFQRFMTMSLPKTEITGEKLAIFPNGAPEGITSARQAQLLTDFMSGNWRTTTQPVNQGGLGAADVRKAFENNSLSETLTPYTEGQINAGKKDGSLVFYGLGIGNPASNKSIKGNEGQIYFGLKRNMDYNEQYGINNPELRPDEVAVVGVMNNELGKSGQGLGVPTSMLKAIEEGATVLDAYAVPSKANPAGFLPDYYSRFGFAEVERIPFDEKYVRNPKYGGSERKYKALVNQWRESGWDESMGNPDMVIMKWKGDENARQDAVKNYVQQSEASFGRETRDLIEGTENVFERGSGQGVRPPSGASQQSNLGGNRGGLLGDGSVLPSRFSRALGEISGFTDTERRALGLLE